MRKFNFLLILLFVFNIKNCFAQNIFYADLDLIIKNSDVGKKIIIYFDNENSVLLEEIKKFQTQIKDKEKKIISGDSEKIKKIYDTWVFSKDVRNNNPNWQLVDTLT